MELDIRPIRRRDTKAHTEQYELYLDYVERHAELRFGRGDPNRIAELWMALTKRLNAMGFGAQRSINMWRKSFGHYKSQMRFKARNGKGLSVLEERFLAIFGHGELAKGFDTGSTSTRQQLSSTSLDPITEKDNDLMEETAFVECKEEPLDDPLLQDAVLNKRKPISSKAISKATSPRTKRLLPRIETTKFNNRPKIEASSGDLRQPPITTALQNKLMHTLENNKPKRERNDLLRQQIVQLRKMHDTTESFRKRLLAQNEEKLTHQQTVLAHQQEELEYQREMLQIKRHKLSVLETYGVGVV